LAEVLRCGSGSASAVEGRYQHDIAVAGFVEADLEAALRFYASNPGYLAGLKAGAPRIDLDGNIAGSVGSKHAHRAEKVLARIKREHEVVAARDRPAAKPEGPRLSLADLRAAAQARKLAGTGAA
jgi:ProP effector